MAEIYPYLDDFALKQLTSSAEAKFYRACRDQLPAHLLVIHSVSLLSSDRTKAPVVGECDFVIFDPNGGFLAVEVKGGGVRHDSQQGAGWFSLDRHGFEHPIKDPFRQSEYYRFRVLSLIKNSLPSMKSVRFPVGHCVVFPDLNDANLKGIIAHNRPREIIASSNDLVKLADWYAKATAYWDSINENFSIGRAGINEIKRILLKPVFAQPSISNQLDDDTSMRFQLTQSQLLLLRCITNNKKANIVGGAGTGKTVLAKQLAIDCARKGLKTLFLCYNKALGDHLSNSTLHTPNLMAGNYHSVFQRLLGDNFGYYFKEARSNFGLENEWEIQRPFAYAMGVDELGLTFDAIIVDEAQDYSPEYWLALESALEKSNTPHFYTFSDTNQKLYSRVDSIPKLSDEFLLFSNCRNTKEIHAEAYQYYEGPEILAPALKGIAVEKEDNFIFSDQISYIAQLLNRLITKESVNSEDIVILAANSELSHNYYLSLNKALPKVNIQKSESKISGSVGFSTVKLFKGLESSIVIVWGLSTLPEYDRKNSCYVGMSRAKSLLYIVD